MKEFEESYQRAIRLLAVKGRFRAELERRLRQERFSEEAITKTIERCICAGYLDDEQRGRQKLLSCARKGYGVQRIALELSQHIDEGIVRQILGDFDEKKALEEYLRKHPKLLKDPKVNLRLLRRGFKRGLIEETVNKLQKEFF